MLQVKWLINNKTSLFCFYSTLPLDVAEQPGEPKQGSLSNFTNLFPSSVSECWKMYDNLEFSTEVSSYPDDEMPIQSKGGYQLDFDNLEAMDPFSGSNKMMLSPARPTVENPHPPQTEPQHAEPKNTFDELTKIESALDETLPFNQSVENSLADLSADISSTESSVVTVVKVAAVEELDSYTATPDEKQPAKMSPSINEDKVSGSFVEDAPLPAKGSYSLDFDNLDAINPFQTGGSKIQNSPVIGKKVPDNNPPVEEVQENKPINVVKLPEVAQELPEEVPVQPAVKPVASVAPISANAAKAPAADTQPSDASIKEGPVKLEFNFDDGGEVRKKQPPKKFGKRPPGLKSKAEKLASDVKPPQESQVKPEASDVAEAPKGAYSFDFEKFDDPNFNPFGTKSSMNNSPKVSEKSSPVLMEASNQEKMDKPVEKEDVSLAWYVNFSLSVLSIYLQQALPQTLNFTLSLYTFSSIVLERVSQLLTPTPGR